LAEYDADCVTPFTIPIDEVQEYVEAGNGNYLGALNVPAIIEEDSELFTAPIDEAHEQDEWVTEMEETPGAKQVFSSIWEKQDKARKGAIAVDIETRIKIEKQSGWLNKLAYQSPSSRLIYLPLKRIIDIVLTLISAPVLLTVMVVVSILIYLDDGLPLFYVHERTGFGGKRFKMYKFRTMKVNAPALPAKVIHTPDGQVRHIWPDKVENDHRITRVGRILRKTSLDEIPQFWNVLMGDMSVIGPRPTSWDVNMYTSLQTERLSVRPGITGLWQVSARESKNFDERLIWDIKYVEKMSLWLDLQILWRTVLQIFHRKGV
jgi:lipopolysaccharide/colanic/teichoic acid biosynthesis glycosyltransferase